MFAGHPKQGEQVSDKFLGSFTFVLHAHMPYVLSHGRWPHGTDWLCEAAAETYIPLLNVLERLADEGVSPKLVLGMTPVLTEQLNDDSFHKEFKAYLNNRIAAAAVDRKEFKTAVEPRMKRLAGMWREFYSDVHDTFAGKYGEDIVGAFAGLQKAGHIEVITSAATHGYLPLLSRDESINAQVSQAVSVHTRNFGRKPRGIWLPECAYRPGYRWSPPVREGLVEPYDRKGVEEIIGGEGIEFFVVDTHMLGGGPGAGVYRDRFDALGHLWDSFAKGYTRTSNQTGNSPYDTYTVSPDAPTGPVAFLPRDPRTGVQVWSGEYGYPASGRYLEFHKKRDPGGLKYWEVTDTKAGLGAKETYRPDEAAKLVREQARHFVSLVKDALKGHLDKTGRPGLLTAPFDAELFGHWWFEGPEWLYQVIRLIDADPEIELATASGYLDGNGTQGKIRLSEGSWGEGGFHYIWLNSRTAWTWEEIYECEARMVSLASEFGGSSDGTLREVLKQSARELLLMQSSDWQFLISTRGAGDYAETRFKEHAELFELLADMAERLGRGESLSEEDREVLDGARKRDRLFENVEPRWWAGFGA